MARKKRPSKEEIVQTITSSQTFLENGISANNKLFFIYSSIVIEATTILFIKINIKHI